VEQSKADVVSKKRSAHRPGNADSGIVQRTPRSSDRKRNEKKVGGKRNEGCFGGGQAEEPDGSVGLCRERFNLLFDSVKKAGNEIHVVRVVTRVL